MYMLQVCQAMTDVCEYSENAITYGNTKYNIGCKDLKDTLINLFITVL